MKVLNELVTGKIQVRVARQERLIVAVAAMVWGLNEQEKSSLCQKSLASGVVVVGVACPVKAEHESHEQ